MAKKEALNKKNLNLDLEKEAGAKYSAGGGKISKASKGALTIIKFILGICLLPFVWGFTQGLARELSFVDKIQQGYFWMGVVAFLAIYFFVWEPKIIYDKGHKLIEIIFHFFQPLVTIAPYLLPVYSILILAFYGISLIFTQEPYLLNIFLVLLGFSTVMHIVFSAQTLRGKKEDLLNSNYIFGFSFLYIINLLLLGGCFVIVFKDFSFINYFGNSLDSGDAIFYAIFKQLFFIK